jgi:peptide/nickel transport system permease protein
VTVFLVRRLVTMLVTLLFASLIVFVVLEILPGDPALLILGIDAQPEQLAALREQMGLNRPAAVRYLDWIAHLATGNFGTSYAYKVPVWTLITERLGLTVPLALMAFALTSLIGIVTGVFAAARHNRAGDVVVMGVSQLGISVPNFWFGLLLILFFAVRLGWFSAGGFAGWEDGALPALKSLLLPAVALATVQGAILARIARSSVLDVLQEDFIRTARAKGLSRRATLWRHALRNAMIPVITIMGLQFGELLVGAIVVEQVFTLPGLGRLIFQSISNRDVEVVKGVVVLLVFMVVAVNFCVDLLYAAIDPRLSPRDV